MGVNYNINIPRVAEIIWELENKYDLFSRKCKGVFYWEIIRVDLFFLILRKLGLEEHQSPVKPISYFAKNLWYYIRYFISKNPLLHLKQKDILIFDHPRKLLINDKYIDIYTQYLADEFDKDKYQVYSRTSDLKVRFNKQTILIDFILFLKKVSQHFHMLIDSENDDIIEQLQLELAERLAIKIDLKKLILNKLKSFKVDYYIFKFIFSKKKPKKIYLVVSYLKQGMIAAAKELGINTVELQHGTVGKYHLGYHFPNPVELSYFPDEFYAFGRYWINQIEFPLTDSHIIYYGFPHLNYIGKKYEQNLKDDKSILFISQGTIGQLLSEWAVGLANKLPNYKIKYKLHPGEYSNWQKRYKLLNQKCPDNLQIISDGSINIYELLSKSQFVIGVYSTVLYEALFFKCNVLLADLPGVENLDSLINEEYAVLVKSVEEIIDLIANNKLKNINNKLNEIFGGEHL